MTPFNRLVSPVVLHPVPDTDTDQIIPARFVNVQGQAALDQALFANLKAADPNFVLNDPAMRGRQILLGGRNFGCGSSREAAAWALAAAGIRAVLAPSFNTTFWTNCVNNGLLPVAVDAQVHGELCAAAVRDAGLQVEIDLEACELRAPAAGIAASFVIEAFARELLLSGQDELGYLLARQDAIRAFATSH